MGATDEQQPHHRRAAGLAALGSGRGRRSTGMASAAAKQAPRSAPGQPLRGRRPVDARVTSCNGGRNLRLYTRLGARPFSFPGTSNALVPSPGAEDHASRARERDRHPAHHVLGGDVLHRFRVDGRPGAQGRRPDPAVANNGSPFAINSSHTYQGNSVQFCTKIGRGRHSITMKVHHRWSRRCRLDRRLDLSVQRFE